jgi:hypothetical protein
MWAPHVSPLKNHKYLLKKAPKHPTDDRMTAGHLPRPRRDPSPSPMRPLPAASESPLMTPLQIHRSSNAAGSCGLAASSSRAPAAAGSCGMHAHGGGGGEGRRASRKRWIPMLGHPNSPWSSSSRAPAAAAMQAWGLWGGGCRHEALGEEEVGQEGGPRGRGGTPTAVIGGYEDFFFFLDISLF